jgi:hypothetical protein
MAERRHSLESSFHGGSNNNPVVGVGVFHRFIRHLECVGFVDLIVVLVLDVIAVAVASNSLFLRRDVVRGKWRVPLAWNDG